MTGAREKSRVPWRYDLASVMIFIVVFAVGLGLSLRMETAGLGVPILLLGPATVVRASPVMVKRRREGRPFDLEGWNFLYIESCAVTGLLLVAASIAFVSVCLPVGCMTSNFHGNGQYYWTAFAGGSLAAFIALVLLGRRIFPPKD